MKSQISDLSVWKDALENFEKSKKTKYKITKDMVHRRLRPEPEIIEHILEDLEEKIRHYFNLFRLEKEKRTTAEKNNYYLQEEIAKAYETLEKNKIHTMKVEGKLKNIKDSQSSLIDTVRRIDLLYIQLDTLVQSFAGVCTQTAIEVVDDTASLEKRKQTISMLLDYIYPCRTLDPRINALYGLLYYQTIGLLTGKYSSPPVPPVPPVVPGPTDGWLPPSHLKHNPLKNGKIFKEIRFADMVEENRKEAFDRLNDNTDHALLSNDKNYDGISGSSDLLGFDIKIGVVEILHKLDNPKIVCVVRYDHETAYASIQNSKRITKSKIAYEMNDGNKYSFNIDSVINLNSLPPRKHGIIPKFKIDIHDVRGKVLIGTAKCSFISEKTLTKNAPWDIFSRANKSEPEIIGKVFVTVFPYPSKAKLPAETFKLMKNKNTSTSFKQMESKDSFNHSQIHSKDLIKSSTYADINNSVSNSVILQKSRNVETKTNNNVPFTPPTKNKLTAFSSPASKSTVKTSTVLIKENMNKTNQTQMKKVIMTPLKQPTTPNLVNSALNKKGHKVTFKTYTPKTEKKDAPEELTPKLVVTKVGDVSAMKQEEVGKATSKATSKAASNVTSNVTSNITTKQDGETNSKDLLEKQKNILDKKNTGYVSNVQMLIKKMGNLNEYNQSKLPISFLKEPIKSKSGLDKDQKDSEDKNDNKNDDKNDDNKNVSMNKEKEESKIKVKLPYFMKNDITLKPVIVPEKGLSSDKVTIKIKNTMSDNKLKIHLDKKTNLLGSNKLSGIEAPKELSTEKMKVVIKDEMKSFTQKTTSVDKMKIAIPKKSSLLKITGKDGLPTSSKELNTSKLEPQGIKKSLLKINHLKEGGQNIKIGISKKFVPKGLLKLKTPDSSFKPELTIKKIVPGSNVEQNKKNSKNSFGSIKESTKESMKQESTKDISTKGPILQKEKVGLLAISKNSETIKSTTDLQKSTPPPVEKSNRNPLLKLLKTRQKEKPPISLKKETSPATPATPTSGTPKIAQLNSDDAELKTILQKAQKKSIFIDKSKIKAIKFKSNEKKRIIKKFVAKFKTPPEE